MIVATLFKLAGAHSVDDVRRLTDRLYDVPGVGAVAIELLGDGHARLIIKHPPSTTPAHEAVVQAVASVDGIRVIDDDSA